MGLKLLAQGVWFLVLQKSPWVIRAWIVSLPKRGLGKFWKRPRRECPSIPSLPPSFAMPPRAVAVFCPGGTETPQSTSGCSGQRVVVFWVFVGQPNVYPKTCVPSTWFVPSSFDFVLKICENEKITALDFRTHTHMHRHLLSSHVPFCKIGFTCYMDM